MTREDHDVPRDVRLQVLDRDGQCCRVCGRYVPVPALHHIEYRSQGGANLAENLVTIGWLPGHDCHLPIVHADKALWQPILQIVVRSPVTVTAFSVRRQQMGHNGRWHDGRHRLRRGVPPISANPYRGKTSGQEA